MINILFVFLFLQDSSEGFSETRKIVHSNLWTIALDLIIICRNRTASQNKYTLKIEIQIQSQLFNSYANYHCCAKSLKRNYCFSIIGTFFSYIKCTAPKFPFLWFLSADKNREPCKNMLFNVQHQLSKLISMQMSSRFKWVFLIQLSLWHSLEILNKGSLGKPHYKRCRPYLGIAQFSLHMCPQTILARV